MRRAFIAFALAATLWAAPTFKRAGLTAIEKRDRKSVV